MPVTSAYDRGFEVGSVAHHFTYYLIKVYVLPSFLFLSLYCILLLYLLTFPSNFPPFPLSFVYFYRFLPFLKNKSFSRLIVCYRNAFGGRTEARPVAVATVWILTGTLASIGTVKTYK